MHVGLEASTKIGDAGVDAILEGVEVIIVSAVQNLLFDEPPQPFDQIQVGRIGGQINEFDALFLGLVGNRLAFLVSGVVQHQSDRAAGARIGVGNFVQELGKHPLVDVGVVGHRNGLMSYRVVSAQDVVTLTTTGRWQ